MSAEDKNAQRKAHSVLVDFFVMYRHIIWIVALGVICVITMTLSFIGILWNPWGEGPIQAVLDLEHEQIRIQAEYNVRTAIQVMGAAGFLATGVLGYMLIWFITSGRKTHGTILEIHSGFIHRAYVTTFELIPHQGKTQIDKLFNHLSLVFPEVKREAVKLRGRSFSDWWEKKKGKWIFRNVKNYDGYFRTDTGDFVLKIFKTTVKWEHIEKIIKQVNQKQRRHKVFDTQVIVRVICLADKYDPFFESDDLVSKMKETKRNDYKIDLILEREFGYSTIWIDR